MDKEWDYLVHEKEEIRCRTLCAFLTGVILKRLTLRRSVFDVCVYILFCGLTCERILYL